MNFHAWCAYVGSLTAPWLKSLLHPSTYNGTRLFALSLVVAILSVLLFIVFRLQKSKGLFKKLSVQGNEIEIFSDSDDSWFDKYLNEVLYLFEHSKADVIVFEDIDRFDINEIFARLREINRLINTKRKEACTANDKKLFRYSLETRAYKPLRFFYLLRDDMFDSKDRTKFFDFMIPVVPVVDSSNSYDQFLKYFQESQIADIFSRKFLQRLSLFVDDMRILRNICNEFIVYYQRLEKISKVSLVPDKMLAMITYKNLFPCDFGELQLRRGFVYSLLAKKTELLAPEITRLQTEVDRKKLEIQNANAKQKPEKENELAALERELTRVRNKRLKDILTRETVDKIFGGITSTVKHNPYFPLLEFLLVQGHIDETYSDYMTYFYENSLRIEDKAFLQSVANRRALSYTAPLMNPALVVEQLDIADFDERETLNYDLINFLSTDENKLSYLIRFLEQLQQTQNFEFISGYLNGDYAIPLFIKHLNHVWADFFSIVVKSKKLTERLIRLYSLQTLYTSDAETLQAVDVERCLAEYVSAQPDYLAIEEPDVDELVGSLCAINVRFSRIDYDAANKDLFNEIYKESLYVRNYNNICLMLRVMYGKDEGEDFAHKNYSLIMTEPDSPLAKYVNDKDHINGYIKLMLSRSNGVITDDESIAIGVLNNTVISKENKCAYVAALKTPIKHIQSVSAQELWSILLEYNVVALLEENIYEYYLVCDKKIGPRQVTYINSQKKKFDFSSVKAAIDEKDSYEFFASMLACDSINDNHYQEILRSLALTCSRFAVMGLSRSKMIFLIDYNILAMEINTLNYIRQQYQELLIHFIARNIVEYTNMIQPHIMAANVNEIVDVLQSDADDTQKIALLGKVTQAISVLDKRFTSAVEAHILEHNFQPNDLFAVVEQYERKSKQVQTAIEDLFVKYNQKFISRQAVPRTVPLGLFKQIAARKLLSIDTLMEVFLRFIIEDCDKQSCRECLNLLEIADLGRAFDGKQPKVPQTPLNKRLLDAIEKNRWIARYEIDKDDNKFYRVYGQQQRKKKKQEFID